MARLKFAKHQRISTSAEYQDILKTGKKFSDNNFRIAVAFHAELEKPKLGVIVGKKNGSAVYRNRIKRIVREIFRLHQENIIPGTNLVVIAKPDSIDKTYSDIEQSIISLLDRANGLKK